MMLIRYIKLILISIFLITSAYADELIVGFEDEDLPVLNEELRKSRDDVDNNTTNITTNTTNIATNIAAIAALAGSTSGKVIQTQSVSEAGAVECNTNIPADNTKPLWSEGVAVLSSSFTPLEATSMIRITVSITAGTSTDLGDVVASLFKNGTGTDPCLVAGTVVTSHNSWPETLCYVYQESAVNTTARTYTVRVGANVNCTLNGDGAGNTKYGGALISTMIIDEFEA